MTLSTMSHRTIEDVSQAAPERLWFQLYVYKDREISRALVQRAEAAGARALVVTVDAPYLGRREAIGHDHLDGVCCQGHLKIQIILIAGREIAQNVVGGIHAPGRSSHTESNPVEVAGT